MASNDSNNKFLHPLRFFLLFTLLVFLLWALLFYALPALSLMAFVLPMVYAAVATALFAALSFLIKTNVKPPSANDSVSSVSNKENLKEGPSHSDAKPLSPENLLAQALPGMATDSINIVLEYCGASPEKTNQLLLLVARGEQDQAEAIIKENPLLALEQGTVTDLSDRTFKNITAFQYALWAMDWHMWTMLLKYLPREKAALQLQELEEKGTAHGKHFSFSPLIEALDTYIKNYSAWDYTQCVTHWIEQVGGAQRLLPAHVINEYCHPSRPFSPCPDFSADVQLPRSMKTDTGEWFTAVEYDGTLGIRCGVLRSSLCRVWRGCNLHTPNVFYSILCFRHDREALQSLLKTRQQQLLGLKNDLASRVAPII